jgi:hypothetical protein
MDMDTYMEIDPKIQDLRIAFEKAISARKKKLFLDAFNEFYERLEELKNLLKKKNIKLEEMYKYFPEVGYMEKSVMERRKMWENS